MARQPRNRTSPERIERIMADNPGWSEADARRYARGHGRPDRITPEHGKVTELAPDVVQVGGRRYFETHSSQAAERIIQAAAKASEQRMGEGKRALRVEVAVTDRAGRVHTLYSHPSVGHKQPGITAHHLRDLIRDQADGSAKVYLANAVYTEESEKEMSDDGLETVIPERWTPGDVRQISDIELAISGYDVE